MDPTSETPPDPVALAFADLTAALRQAALQDDAAFDRIQGYRRIAMRLTDRWKAGEVASPRVAKGEA